MPHLNRYVLLTIVYMVWNPMVDRMETLGSLVLDSWKTAEMAEAIVQI